MIDRVLNDAWSTQSASDASLNDSLVEEGIRRAIKPDEGHIAEVARPKPLERLRSTAVSSAFQRYELAAEQAVCCD